jgi:transposase
VFASCADPAGVTAMRRGAPGTRRAAARGLARHPRPARGHRAADGHRRGELGLAELATSITGLSAVGAASILAETGDPARPATGQALAGHAGLAPRQKTSGTYTGRTRTTGQGRPGLRLAAWRAVWGALKSNPVYAARFAHLTSREHNKLSTGQAHAVLAAALLRQLHAVITTGQRWDPAIAAGGRKGQQPTAA